MGLSATVITFAYNQKPYLVDASVRSSLAMAGCQQVILVDDGSAIPIEDIWGDGRVDLVRHHKNRGVPAAYATALERIACPWVVRSMSDDEQDPNKLEFIEGAFVDGVPDAVFHDHRKKGDETELVRYHPNSWHSMVHGNDNTLYGCATLLAADLLRAMGPHPYHLRHCHDWWLHVRIAKECGWHHVPEVLSTQGVYSHGLSRTRDEVVVQLERRWVMRRARGV